jgi:hypothetical protein
VPWNSTAVERQPLRARADAVPWKSYTPAPDHKDGPERAGRSSSPVYQVVQAPRGHGIRTRTSGRTAHEWHARNACRTAREDHPHTIRSMRHCKPESHWCVDHSYTRSSPPPADLCSSMHLIRGIRAVITRSMPDAAPARAGGCNQLPPRLNEARG